MGKRYAKIDDKLFIDNRRKFANHLGKNALAIFNSNDIFGTSADSTLAFKQHSDIFYLSGIDQEESILILFPDHNNPKHREILFLKETSENIRIWEGDKLTKEQATAASGIPTIYWLNQFEKIFKELMAEAELVYLNTNEHLRANTEMQTREDRFNLRVKAEYPAHAFMRSAPIMHAIRAIKHDSELGLMQKACDITESGFKRILPFIKPGVMEYEIEAELIHEFTRLRSYGFAYTPIIASGESACILHYIDNNQECKDGDVLLMDFGAEYANYCSDLTRSVPVNGRFNTRQRAVYDAVLRVKNEATNMLRPGVLLSDYHKEVGKVMESELLGLGLIDRADIQNQDENWPAYKKYFMHGTSHFIGLDTHDVGLWHEPIQENMCFTVEPGIYIREEGLGIRLEDDVVVQADGAPFNLMQNIPIEAEEIETLMNASSVSAMA
ncbi:MAG: aminopeptidase P family protein [Flavobacteriales bacterium]|nr:aminopeptidase P family protein [Flavobacteriales bacterium]